MSDTVGFIDRLPHALVAAFRATLEEVADADLLLHVIDASNADRDRQMAAVRQRARGSGRRIACRSLEVFNKCDALDAASARAAARRLSRVHCACQR